MTQNMRIPCSGMSMNIVLAEVGERVGPRRPTRSNASQRLQGPCGSGEPVFELKGVGEQASNEAVILIESVAEVVGTELCNVDVEGRGIATCSKQWVLDHGWRGRIRHHSARLEAPHDESRSLYKTSLSDT